jgi:organic radical activating enzyme
MNLEKYQKINQRDYEAVAGPDWPSYSDFQQHNSVDPSVYAEIDDMLTGPLDFTNSAFCVLPFFGMEIPSQKACCLFSTDDAIEDIKSSMLQGQRPRACSTCWSLEDAGIKSDRMIKNETLDFYFDQDLSSLFEQCQQGKNSVVHYKIDTSNTCNSTCVTCNSTLSSLWGQLESQNGVTPYKNWSLTADQVLPDIDFAQAKSIGFRGGEPLLSRTNFEILQKLIDHGNTNCFVNFTTNGSVELTQTQKNILSHFSSVNMCFSIDGVGPVFEYLRYPLKWEVLLKNIDYCKTHNIMVSASFTVSNLNLYYFTEIVNWFDSNQIRYLVNCVYSPACFSPSALPYEIKQKILARVNNPSITKFLSNHSQQDDLNYQELLKETAKQDKWKGIRLQDYLPELYKLLD